MDRILQGCVCVCVCCALCANTYLCVLSVCMNVNVYMHQRCGNRSGVDTDNSVNHQLMLTLMRVQMILYDLRWVSHNTKIKNNYHPTRAPNGRQIKVTSLRK